MMSLKAKPFEPTENPSASLCDTAITMVKKKLNKPSSNENPEDDDHDDF